MVKQTPYKEFFIHIVMALTVMIITLLLPAAAPRISSAYADTDSKDIADESSYVFSVATGTTEDDPVDARYLYREAAYKEVNGKLKRSGYEPFIKLFLLINVNGVPVDEYMWGDEWSKCLSITACTDASGGERLMDPGSGFIVIEGKGDYTGRVTIPAVFKLRPDKDDLDASVKDYGYSISLEDAVAYSGKNASPRDPNKWFIIPAGPNWPAEFDKHSGKSYLTLKSGRDFDLISTKYTGSVKVGARTVEYSLRLKGDYFGEYTYKYKFKVVPPKVTVKKAAAGKGKFTLTIKKQTAQTDGFRIKAYDRNKGKYVKTKLIKSNKKTKLVVSGIKKGAWIDAEIQAYKTLKGKKYYSPVTNVKGVLKIK